MPAQLLRFLDPHIYDLKLFGSRFAVLLLRLSNIIKVAIKYRQEGRANIRVSRAKIAPSLIQSGFGIWHFSLLTSSLFSQFIHSLCINQLFFYHHHQIIIHSANEFYFYIVVLLVSSFYPPPFALHA